MQVQVNTIEYFIVRDRTTGGGYLSYRKSRTAVNQPAYRWSKSGRSAAKRFLTYDAVQKAAHRYGGEIVRCTKVMVHTPKSYRKVTFQEVV